jgi:hypothetical protein
MTSPDVVLYAALLAAFFLSIFFWSLSRATANLNSGPETRPRVPSRPLDDISWDAVDPDKIWRRAYRWDTL